MATHQLRGRDQRGQLLPRVEHARLYCGLGDADYVTTVRDGRLELKLRGLFRHRCIPLADIRNIEVIGFSPVRDYGGYGIRSLQNGKAWLADSTTGLKLELRNNETLIVGTRQPAELTAALTPKVPSRTARKISL